MLHGDLFEKSIALRPLRGSNSVVPSFATRMPRASNVKWDSGLMALDRRELGASQVSWQGYVPQVRCLRVRRGAVGSGSCGVTFCACRRMFFFVLFFLFSSKQGVPSMIRICFLVIFEHQNKEFLQ